MVRAGAVLRHHQLGLQHPAGSRPDDADGLREVRTSARVSRLVLALRMTTDTTTPTLTDWLLDRIAEDEAAARAAVIPAWSGHRPHGDLAVWRYQAGGEVEYDWDGGDGRTYVTCDGEGLTSSVDELVGPHIARHDPARVLAECESKRAIVAMHWDSEREWDWTCDLSATAMEMFPCLTLCHLAAPYADREGFRDEWAVR